LTSFGEAQIKLRMKDEKGIKRNVKSEKSNRQRAADKRKK
jgi:hypothetical protein